MRWATNWIMSRSRSASAPFSLSSASAILVLVVIVVSSVEVDGVVTTTLTRNRDDRPLRGAVAGTQCPRAYGPRPLSANQSALSYTTAGDVSYSGRHTWN